MGMNGVPILGGDGKAIGRFGDILQPTGDGRMMGISRDDNNSKSMGVMSGQTAMWHKLPCQVTGIRFKNGTRDDFDAKFSIDANNVATVTITRRE